VLTDRLADVLFTDGHDMADHLESEGIERGRIQHVGNPAIDLLRRFEEAARDTAAWRRLDVPAGGYVLVTLHRSENVRDRWRVLQIVDALAALAGGTPVVMPLHPATHATLSGLDALEPLRRAGIHLLGPLRYLDFLSLEQSAGAILTDSGGVQDEASALGVRCFTLRRATERVLTLTHGTNTLLGDDPAEIAEVALAEHAPVPAAIPLWEGRAGQRIAAALGRRYTLELAS